MSLAKGLYLTLKSPIKTTINLTILETQLKRCQNLKQFNQILSQMIFTGYINETFAASRLVSFSTSSHFINTNYYHKLLLHIHYPNAFTWNTIMRAFLHRNCPKDSIFLYKTMLGNDVFPDNHTFPILLQASSVLKIEFLGLELHNHVLKMGFDSDVYVVNTLINMYSVCGSVVCARKVFDGSPVFDIVSWNSILASYVKMENVEQAKFIYNRMPERNVIASNSMIVLFGQLGRVDEARELFNNLDRRDIVTWTALITCYEKNEMFEKALLTFTQMNLNRIMVDEIVSVSVISACTHLSRIKEGKIVHGLALRIGIDMYVNLQNALIHMYSTCDDIVAAEKLFTVGYHLDQFSWNSMISGYLKLGLVDKAKGLFDSMPRKDIVSWCAMISGSAQLDRFSDTLTLFNQMQVERIKADEATLVSVISVCTRLASLEQGKWVHAYIKKNDITVNVILGTTLIHMYMRCGDVESALEVISTMKDKGVSTWNALICGLAMNGLVDRSLEMFADMKNCGIEPNEITFIGVLDACRHMGLVVEGKCYFNSMIKEHNIEPNVKHYGCLVDLLGRAGLLEEAEKLIEHMPMAPDVATWGALLGACRKHNDNEMGERIGKKLIELDPDHDGFHVLLSNIYASRGNWNNVSEIRGLMVKQNVKKIPGCSMIEADGIVHEFLAGDKTHCRIDEIEEMLDEIGERVKALGYMSSWAEVSFDIDDEEKEASLSRHSEKLAVAYGLIVISPPTPIRIIKNLRICNDCHVVMKLISRSFDREIVVRDRHRFHHFRQGSCSCKDYW